jgi:hypothetical protein
MIEVKDIPVHGKIPVLVKKIQGNTVFMKPQTFKIYRNGTEQNF